MGPAGLETPIHAEMVVDVTASVHEVRDRLDVNGWIPLVPEGGLRIEKQSIPELPATG